MTSPELPQVVADERVVPSDFADVRTELAGLEALEQRPDYQTPHRAEVLAETEQVAMQRLALAANRRFSELPVETTEPQSVPGVGRQPRPKATYDLDVPTGEMPPVAPDDTLTTAEKLLDTTALHADEHQRALERERIRRAEAANRAREEALTTESPEFTPAQQRLVYKGLEAMAEQHDPAAIDLLTRMEREGKLPKSMMREVGERLADRVVQFVGLRRSNQ